MIAALPLIFLGALTFVEQDMTDDLFPAYLQADLDQDGKLDLILSSAVYFQRNGGFSQAVRVAFPDTDEPLGEAAKKLPYCDVWKDTLFICTPEKLSLFRREGGAWKTVHTQPMKWAGAFPQSGLNRNMRPELTEQQRVTLSRFLHDLNGDGVPEIVSAAEDGLHFYARKEQGYAEAARIDVFPGTQNAPALHPPEILWPEAVRSPVFPERLTGCEYMLDGNQLTLFNRDPVSSDEMRYRTKRIALGPAFTPIPESAAEAVTQPMPVQFFPAHIGKDGHIDYAGVTREERETTIVSSLLCSYRMTVDDGKTFRGARAAFYWSRDPFLDFNQDGALDLAIETTTLFDGGIKETVARVMTARDVDGEIRIYLQDPPGSLPKQPSIVFRFTRKMEEPLAFGGWLPHFGQFSVRGDFNGDGRRDLLLPVTTDDLAVHLFNGKSFEDTPACILSRKDWAALEVTDFDGDGRSDVFVEGGGIHEDDSGPHCRLYLTRESTP